MAKMNHRTDCPHQLIRHSSVGPVCATCTRVLSDAEYAEWEVGAKRNPHGRNGKERQELATPRWLAAEIHELAWDKFGEKLQLDVCAHPENAVCEHFFTKEQNGLQQPWHPHGPVFCNPPFSQVYSWLDKFVEQEPEELKAVFLLRGGDLQTKWVKDFGYLFEIEMLTPRVNYLNWRKGRIERGANFPSMLWWYNSNRKTPLMHSMGSRDGGLWFKWRELRPSRKGAL